MYNELEAKFNVIYPENESATYKSLVNYSDDLNKPFQRWYRYKEGFSIELVKKLIQKYNKNKEGVILDPFLGSGTTLLAARDMSLRGIGFEVNPFSFFLSKMKLSDYDNSIALEFKDSYRRILEKGFSSVNEYKLPLLSTSHKVFKDNIREYYMRVKYLINTETLNDVVKDLMLLGWLSCLEEVSNYRKAGNGLKIKKYKNPKEITKEDVYNRLIMQYDSMYNDLMKHRYMGSSNYMNIYNESCLKMRNWVGEESISGIIFSPPYANCFDYTEIYKLELWFGEFINDYPDLKMLRNESLHSHLNGKMDLSGLELSRSTILDSLLEQLSTKELWDKRIPNMIKLYFNDMFKLIDLCYESLEENGFCCIIVGNSSYGGIIIPTDLLLADYAKKKGFIVDSIEVDRYIITSSQQYEITKENKKFLRESVICLKKESTSKKAKEDNKKNIEVVNLPIEIESGETYTIKQANPNNFTHNYFKYPCKFIPEIPRWAMKKYCQDSNCSILDPFAGSGTTLLEAFIQGHNSYGTDIDDIAKLIARVKTQVFSVNEIEEITSIFADINLKVLNNDISPVIPEIDNLEHWFTYENIDVLGKLKRLIDDVKNIKYNEFLKVCFISIIKKCSRADDSSPKPYVSKKVIKNPANPIKEFSNVFNKYILGMKELSSISNSNKVTILEGNALNIDVRNKVDIAITSPPYINAFDYGRTLRLENLWMGFLTELELRNKKKDYIGTEKIKVKEEVMDLSILEDSNLLKNYYNQIVEIDEKRALIVKRFFEDMKANMLEVKTHLKSEGYYCIVIGNSTIRKVNIESWKVLVEIALKIGYKLDEYFNYTIQNPYINIPRNGKGGKISKDYVIVLRSID